MRGLIAAAFLLLLAAMAAVLVASDRTARAEAWLNHTFEVRRGIAASRALLSDLETGQRGFLLSGDEAMLAPFHAARAALPEEFARLRTLTSDNPEQLERLLRVETLALRRAEAAEGRIRLARAGRRAEAIRQATEGEGVALMEAARTGFAALDQHEARLLAERAKTLSLERAYLLYATVTALGLSLLLSVIVFIALGRYIRRLEDTTIALQSEMRSRAQLDAQLREVQKLDAVGRLTGGIAHDFNNMLQIISGALQLLNRHLTEPDARTAKLIASAADAADRAGALTKRLLAFSRRQPLDPKPTNVNRLVANLSTMLDRTLGGGVQVETVLAGGLWTTLVDPPQLESAILNLAVNGRDAMNGDGKLTIETANAFLDQRYAAQHADVTPGQYVLVAVTDNGAGMPPEVLENAFEPFFTTKERGMGTGLGLSQVHGFVKQSGGHVKIYSELGAGTTVKLYLPRHAGEAAAEEEVAVASAARIGRTVLLVEDEAGVRAFVKEALLALGCDVIEASSGQEALAKLRTAGDVHLLLTDVVMPGMNGRTVADRVLEQRSGVKVVFMTGFTHNAIVHNGMVDAGVRLLTKPFTLAQLELELNAALAEAEDAGEKQDG